MSEKLHLDLRRAPRLVGKLFGVDVYVDDAVESGKMYVLVNRNIQVRNFQIGDPQFADSVMIELDDAG